MEFGDGSGDILLSAADIDALRSYIHERLNVLFPPDPTPTAAPPGMVGFM